MSFRAGPVRNNRRQVRQAPYARPPRPAAGAAVAEPPQRQQPAQRPQSWFSRLKQFFWGAPATAREPRQSEPPILLGHDESEPEPAEDTQYADEDSETSTGSRIVHTSRSFSMGLDAQLDAQPDAQIEAPGVTDGPNEALRQFFETKGDSELSNMEVVGVLSLIGQAVSRNESLVDFSQLSMDQRSDVDATAGETSVLRGLHAPPSPQLYRQGTPPASARRAADRSPWSSTPRRSSIRARHSLAAAPPHRSSPAASSARPPRPSGLRNSLARGEQQASGARASYAPQPRVTPAASAILQALDNDASPRKHPVLSSQRPSRIFEDDRRDSGAAESGERAPAPPHASSQPSVSTPIGTARAEPSRAAGAALPSSLLGSSRPSQTAAVQPTPAAASSKPAFASEAKPVAVDSSRSDGSSSSDNSISSSGNSNISKRPLALQPQPQPSEPQQTGTQSTTGAEAGLASEPEASAFTFEIPPSTAAREVTPAEEAIIAETQSEFTF